MQYRLVGMPVDPGMLAGIGLIVGGLALSAYGLVPARSARRRDDSAALHAAHAELLSRAGDTTAAARAYERAIELTANTIERAELERRLSALR